MTNKAQDVVKASLAADSLALGVHWIYETDMIVKEYGRVDRLLPPGPESYHPTKKQGEFTHYGDQTMVLLETVAETGGFDAGRFFIAWQDLFKDYSGYQDMATKSTLRQISRGEGVETSGSPSNDIAGAARIAPLVTALRSDADALDAAARAQTRMTHSDGDTVDAAAFFARVCLACLDGTPPSVAVREIAGTGFSNTPTEMWALQGLDAAGRDSLSAVLGFGQSCHTPEAFSGVVQIIARYEQAPADGIVEAVMTGGDNAARASLVGQVLAAYNGADEFITDRFNELAARDRIQSLLNRIG